MLSFVSTLMNDPSDKEKIDRLYRTYRSGLLKIANYYLRDKYLAEDALHDVFEKLIANPSLIPEGTPKQEKAFLGVMTKNMALDIKKSRENQNVSLESLNEDALRSDDLEKDYFKNEQIKQMFKYIDLLDDKYKDALILRYINGMPETEIAKLFNTNYTTIRKRIERAKKMVYDMFKKDGWV